MGRLIGLLSLMLGLGVTAYYSAQERGLRDRPVGTIADGGAARAMDGDPIPTPRP